MVKQKHLTPKAEIEVLQQLSQRASAWALGCTARTLRERKEIPRVGGRYDARSLVEWTRRKAAQAGGDSGRTKEALEREKLRKITLANDKSEGKLVPREAFHETLSWAASGIRACGERLRREHGEKALAILDECLDSLDAECARAQAAFEAAEKGRTKCG